MSEPIFARTRYEYASYSDFFELVRLSGFKTCYIDQIDLEQNEIYVFAPANGEIRPHIAHRRSILKGPQQARLCLWMLEKPYNPAATTPAAIKEKASAVVDECLKFCEAIWISDRWIASIDSRYVYAELGSHPELAKGARLPIQYDFAHMSCSVPRRDGIYSQLAKHLRMGPNAWGDERDRILRSTRAMVNVHQDDGKVCEPIRVAIAAAYRLAYLTEECFDPYPLVPGQTCHQAPYASLANDVRSWFAHQDLAGMGEALYQRLCVSSNFRKGVMDALERTFL